MKINFPLPSKTHRYLGLYAFLIYLLFVIATIPAQQVWQSIPQENKAQIQLGHLQGTLWSGQVDNLQLNNLSLGKFNWKLNLLPLFIGQLGLDTEISSTLGKLQANITIDSDGNVEATDINAQIPAESLNPFTLPATLEGKITLNLEKLVYQVNQKIQLEGQAQWSKASISLMQSMQIGEVRLLSNADEEGSIIRVSNEKSALGIEGTIKIKANGQYKVNLSLINREPSRKDIRALLQMLGKADASGKVHLKRQGQLKLAI